MPLRDPFAFRINGPLTDRFGGKNQGRSGSFSLGMITSWNWSYWPIFLLPFGVIGLGLLIRIWHAIPSGKKKK